MLIDIAVRRDVEPAVRHLPGVMLRDIDDLAQVAQADLSGRRRAARQAGEIVEEELRRFTRPGSGPNGRILDPRHVVAPGLRSVGEAVSTTLMKRSAALPLCQVVPRARR